MVIEIELLHFLHGLNERSDVQIVVILQEIAKCNHASTSPNVLQFSISSCTEHFVVLVLIVTVIVVVLFVSHFEHIPLFQLRIEGLVWRQTGKIQFGGMIEPFVRKIRFGFGNFVGLEEGRIGYPTSQVIADIEKLETARSDLCVRWSLLDDVDVTGVFIIFVGVHVSSQPRNEVRFDQVEVVFGTVESEHGNLSAIMMERTQESGQFLTGPFPLWDHTLSFFESESFQIIILPFRFVMSSFTRLSWIFFPFFSSWVLFPTLARIFRSDLPSPLFQMTISILHCHKPSPRWNPCMSSCSRSVLWDPGSRNTWLLRIRGHWMPHWPRWARVSATISNEG